MAILDFFLLHDEKQQNEQAVEVHSKLVEKIIDVENEGISDMKDRISLKTIQPNRLLSISWQQASCLHLTTKKRGDMFIHIGRGNERTWKLYCSGELMHGWVAAKLVEDTQTFEELRFENIVLAQSKEPLFVAIPTLCSRTGISLTGNVAFSRWNF